MVILGPIAPLPAAALTPWAVLGAIAIPIGVVAAHGRRSARGRQMARNSAEVRRGRTKSAPKLKPTASTSAAAPRSELRFRAVPTAPTPTADTVLVSRHAAEQYQHRVKPGLDIDAARHELERLRAMADVSPRAPGWLNAAKPAPYYLLIGDAVVLPLLPQGEGWVATTCVTQRTLTQTRRDAKSGRKASLGARKRAARRARF